MICFYKYLRAFWGKRNLSFGMFFFLFFIQLAFLSSCITKSHIDIVLKNKSKLEALNIDVANIQVINHQIIINGSNLNNVTSFKIKNGSTTTDLQIESKTNTSIIANTLSNVNFAVGTIFDFVLSSANAAATFQVAFTNTNNSITASMLTSMGATKGQIMKYNGSAWVPSSITNAQTYLGTYDATANNPDLSSPSSTPGDYFIVSVAGTLNSISYSVGDWIISDGYNWQKVANSAVVVSTFNGRRGIVTTLPTDYVLLKNGSGKLTGSSINDLADVNIATPLNGSVLKYDSATSKWIVGVDNSGGGAYTGPINKAVITDGTTGALTNSTTTAAELGFVSGVTSSIQTQLNGKLSTTLNSGNFLVGSAGNAATAVTLFGDATLANTGAITLKNTGTAGTFTSVTTDAQGRVTGGTNPAVVTGITGTAPVTIGGTATAPIVSMASATTAVNGYLTNTDWNIFNNKQSALSAGAIINGIVYPTSAAATLQIPLAPVGLTDAVNKQYVDSLAAGAWSSGSGNVYRVTGNVGIGTTIPFSMLANTNTNSMDENSKGTFSSTSLTWSHANNAYTASIANSDNGNDANGLLVKIAATSSSAKAFTVNVAGSDKFLINGLGNIGIGIPNPSANVHIYNNGVSTEFRAQGNAGSFLSFSGTNGPVNLITSSGKDLSLMGGNIGIGTTGPTALLHLKAGTSSAGSAPLKFTTGTKLSVIEDGVMEYDGTDYWLSVGVTRYKVPKLSATGSFTMSNGFYATAGAVGAPSISFTGDTGTGIWHPTTNTIALSTNSIERLRIDSSGNVGIGTSTPTFNLTIGDGSAIDGSFMALGYGTVGTTGVPLTIAGAGTRMFWYPKKAAFRAGAVTGTNWDDVNIGNYSAAFGNNTMASGDSSFVAGRTSQALGQSSAAFGEASYAIQPSSIAIGRYAYSNGDSATSIGDHANTFGHSAIAIGTNNKASGDYSMTLGTGAATGSGFASTGGNYSMAIGLGNPAGTIPYVSGTSSLGIFMGDQSGVAVTANNVMAILGGNVGIGVTAPTSKLEVAGSVRSTSGSISSAYAAATNLTIDFSQANIITTTASCGAVSLSNMQDGGSYTLIVTGTSSGMCTFAHSGVSSFKFSPTNGLTDTSGSGETVYTFLKVGAKVYVSWITGMK